MKEKSSAVGVSLEPFIQDIFEQISTIETILSENAVLEEGSIAGGSFSLAIIDLGEALRSLEKNREKIDESCFRGLFEDYGDEKWSLVDKYNFYRNQLGHDLIYSRYIGKSAKIEFSVLVNEVRQTILYLKLATSKIPKNAIFSALDSSSSESNSLVVLEPKQIPSKLPSLLLLEYVKASKLACEDLLSFMAKNNIRFGLHAMLSDKSKSHLTRALILRVVSIFQIIKDCNREHRKEYNNQIRFCLGQLTRNSQKWLLDPNRGVARRFLEGVHHRIMSGMKSTEGSDILIEAIAVLKDISEKFIGPWYLQQLSTPAQGSSIPSTSSVESTLVLPIVATQLTFGQQSARGNEGVFDEKSSADSSCGAGK